MYLRILGYFFWFSAIIVFAVFQFRAGYIGIAHELGHFWAWFALIAAFLLRFTLPITIGAFFGAMNVWDWHWAVALLFAAPGLIFIFPGMIAAATFSAIKR